MHFVNIISLHTEEPNMMSISNANDIIKEIQKKNDKHQRQQRRRWKKGPKETMLRILRNGSAHEVAKNENDAHNVNERPKWDENGK